MHLAFVASTSTFSIKKEIFLSSEKSSRPELPSRLRPCYFHHVHRLVVSLTFPRRYMRNTANQPLVLRVISVQRTGHNKSSFLAGLLSISKANCRRWYSRPSGIAFQLEKFNATSWDPCHPPISGELNCLRMVIHAELCKRTNYR